MLKELIHLANHLDSKGFKKEADALDDIITKKAYDDEWLKDWNPKTNVPVYIKQPVVFWEGKWDRTNARPILEVGKTYTFQPHYNKPEEMMGHIVFKGYDLYPWITGKVTNIEGGQDDRGYFSTSGGVTLAPGWTYKKAM